MINWAHAVPVLIVSDCRRPETLDRARRAPSPATAALSGVLLTQYSQRRLSQESRVWQEQARLYVELIAWGRNVEYLVRPWSAVAGADTGGHDD